MSERIIGIGGGVGPMAGVDFHKKIIENTSSGGTDKGHLNVIHLSYPSDITDRTSYLLSKELENPAEGMFRKLIHMGKIIEKSDRELIFGVPCNTFHAPVIFNRFLDLIKQHKVDVRVMHMINEVGKFILSHYPNVKNIGLMSTNGTRDLRVYHDILESIGLNIVEVSRAMQMELHNSIYNKERGIKAVSPVTSKARYNFEKYCKELKLSGAEVIVLGCTEIPLALPENQFDDIPLIDTTYVFARALVEGANSSKLKKDIL